MQLTQDSIYTLNNGKKIYASQGIVGLGADGQMYDGYDGCLSEGQPLTREETVEICDFMIELWTKKREHVLSN